MNLLIELWVEIFDNDNRFLVDHFFFLYPKESKSKESVF